ncbi:hypothetical protein ACR0ST_08025 [Aliidiomarina sp. Khilg15.8]
MVKYSFYAVLAAALMALVYVTMDDSAVATAEQDCISSPQIVTPPSGADCKKIDVTNQEGGISWPAWLTGTDSIQFHYLDLLELLFSSSAPETAASKPNSSTSL